jgi:apolipoprotein N-acyltransferase
MWGTVFLILAIVAVFTCLHALVHTDELGTAFVIALLLFLTCVWIASQHDVTFPVGDNTEESP